MIFNLLTLLGGLSLVGLGLRNFVGFSQRFWGERLTAKVSANLGSTPAGSLRAGMLVAMESGSRGAMSVVVEYCNSAMVNLRQGIWMMMGTTVGSLLILWVVALIFMVPNLTLWAMPLLGMAFVARLCRMDEVAKLLISIGLLALGMTLTSSSLGELMVRNVDYTLMQGFLSQGYLSLILMVLVGAFVGAVVRGATLLFVVAIILASVGWLSVESALGLMLGGNIGATASAHYAALGAGSNSARVALSQTIMALWGALWFGVFLPMVILFCQPWFTQLPVALVVVALYSLFHVANLLLFWQLGDMLVRMVLSIIPQQQGTSGSHLRVHSSDSPTWLLLSQAQTEISLHSNRLLKMFNLLEQVGQTPDRAQRKLIVERIEKYKSITDNVQTEIIDFVCSLASNHLKEGSRPKMRKVIVRVQEQKQIALAITTMASVLERGLIVFDEPQRQAISELFVRLRDGIYTTTFESADFEAQSSLIEQHIARLTISDLMVYRADEPTANILFGEFLSCSQAIANSIKSF